MKLVLFTLLLIGSSYALAGVNKEAGYNLAYRQLNYQLEDVQGDYALYTRIKMTPKAIFYATIGSNVKYQKYLSYIREEKEKYAEHFDSNIRLMEYEEFKNKKRDGVDPDFIKRLRANKSIENATKEIIYSKYLNDVTTIEGNVDPIKRDELANSLLQVMREELNSNGIEPKRGEFHQWSNDFKYKRFDHLFPASSMSKLLSALALGRTYLYMITETEDELAAWMLDQPHESITLPELFRASYKLNDGDVYKTLLTIENLLSYHWMTKDRERLGPILRLRPINNFYQNKGDKYGSWYHLFGLILYGYVQGDLSSRFVSFVESIGSHIMIGEPEPQEDFINSAGGPIGAKLRKFVKKKKAYDGEDYPHHLQEDYHLNIGEDYRARLYFAHDRDFDLGFERFRSPNNKNNNYDRSYVTAVIKSKLDYMLSNCKADVFTINKDRLKNRLVATTRITLQPGKVLKIKSKNVRRSEISKIIGMKVELSSCSVTAGLFQLTTNQFFK